MGALNFDDIGRLPTPGDNAAIAARRLDDGTQFVWVVEDGELTVHQRQVSVGEVTGTEGIRVTSGLEPGDRIVVTGVTQLREGMKIRLMN